MEIDANCKGADSLADWYQNERPNAVISSVSSSGGAGGGFVRDLLTIGMANPRRKNRRAQRPWRVLQHCGHGEQRAHGEYRVQSLRQRGMQEEGLGDGRTVPVREV
ncbi:hypothetical protein L596_027646 [Steinernema carpocapsae]|uniref:Uncharacterized protein n=1 Tax=Steinernema carpocapsae TaxID=34508 RepID=A0A4U5LW36_STECR|nr:hypothetical protein L596_027646 [Steinernema carpocapsae]